MPPSRWSTQEKEVTDMADIVTFRKSDGTQVSNDPRFGARGLEAQVRKQQEALRKQQAASEVPPVPEPDPDEGDEDEETQDDASDYSSMSSKELKAEAQRREIPLSGVTKKSQLVELLEQDDEEE